MNKYVKYRKFDEYVKLLYPYYDSLSEENKIIANEDIKILERKFRIIDDKFCKCTEMQNNDNSKYEILKEIIAVERAKSYFDRIYPNYEKLNPAEKQKALINKKILIENLHDIEMQIKESYNNIEFEKIDREMLLKFINIIKTKTYFKILYPDFKKLDENGKCKASKDKIIISNNIDKVESIFYKQHYANSENIFSDRKIIEGIVNSIKCENLFEKLYPDFNILSVEEKIVANNSRRILANNIEKIETEYDKYFKNEGEKELSEKEFLISAINSAKVNEYMEKLCDNYNTLSIDEKIKMNKYKDTISQNLKCFEMEYDAAMQRDSIAQKKGYSEKKIIQEIIHRIQTKMYFNKLYPNFNSISSEERVKAVMYQNIILKNIELINQNFKKEDWDKEDKTSIFTYLDSLKEEEKEYTSIEKINLNSYANKNKEYIEVEKSWIQKLLSKLNIFKRFMKKQKALPKGEK